MRELHGEAAEWAVTEHLLAAVVDHLAQGNWMFATAHTPPKKRAPDPPEPLPRPSPDGWHSPEPAHGSAKPSAATTAEIAAFFGRLGQPSKAGTPGPTGSSTSGG